MPSFNGREFALLGEAGPPGGQPGGNGFSPREVAMARTLEKIATGRSGQGAKLDVEVMRGIAAAALREIGWPVKDQAHG